MIKRCRLHIRTTVPPGHSVVGVHPHTLFRLERAKLPAQPGLWLGHAIGTFLPFDGHIHDIRGIDGTTLCVGGMFAFHVRNDTSAPKLLEMQVGGTAVDWEAPEVSHNTVLGLFAQEVTEEPERDDEAQAELTVAVFPRLIPQLDEAGLRQLTSLLEVAEAELMSALGTPEGRATLAQRLLDREGGLKVLKHPGLSRKPVSDDGLFFELTPELFETLEARDPSTTQTLLDKLGTTREAALAELQTAEGRVRIGAVLVSQDS